MHATTIHPNEVIAQLLKEDGNFPNNNRLELLVYKNAFPENPDPASIENVLKENKWKNSWRNGIYHYHHYHSTAHEVLAVYNGHATVQWGGPNNGIEVELTAGDVVIVPAGVAHKNLSSSKDFKCIGAYPKGQDFDMNYGKDGERPGTDNKIKKVPLPEADPVYGKEGPLLEFWKKGDRR